MTQIVYNRDGIPFDIDAIATDLNGKMDIDCLNRSNEGSSVMVNMSMPSSTYSDLVLGTSGSTYTAPANGYMMVNIYNITTPGYLYMSASGWVDEKRVTVPGVALTTTVPIRKGGTVTIRYDADGTKVFRFYYAVGSESEAS